MKQKLLAVVYYIVAQDCSAIFVVQLLEKNCL
jgi:hypothetical protein